ncbi:MAG: hypothetical protein ACPLRN_01450 [Microgenomates group bacterium]
MGKEIKSYFNYKRLLIYIFLAALIIINFNRSKKLFKFDYLTNYTFNEKEYEKLYLNSQWVIPESKNSIGDDILYTYAGYKYINGTDPSLLNPEHPPLAKNLIGLSIIFLKNQYYYSFISGILAIFSFYLLSKKIIKSSIIAFLTSMLLFFEPLFVANYFSPLLDLLMFAFLNFYFIQIIDFSHNQSIKNLIFAQVFLGLIISTKFFLIAIPIIVSSFIFLFFKNYKLSIKYLFSLTLSFLIYIVNYFQFFIKGKNIVDFLKVQKFIFNFHIQGRKDIIIFNDSFFKLIFLGRFYLDNKKLISIENHYSLLWPSSLSGFIIFLIMNFKKIIKKQESILLFWIFFYFILISNSFVNSRYLILILPYFYFFSANLLNKIIKSIKI